MATTTERAYPTDLYDDELGAPIAYRCDRVTRGQAQQRIAADYGYEFVDVVMRKTWVRWDQTMVDEWEADGAKEPYDGWPAWRELGPGDDREGAVAYWTSGCWSEPEIREPAPQERS